MFNPSLPICLSAAQQRVLRTYNVIAGKMMARLHAWVHLTCLLLLVYLELSLTEV